MRNSGIKTLLFTVLCIVPLLLTPAKTVLGGPNPPTGAEHLAGPAIVGGVEIVPDLSDPDNQISASFSGNCKGQPVILGPAIIEITFDDVTAEDLKDQRLLGAGPPGCLSDFGGENLIINVVTRFVKETVPDEVINANVVILYVVGKGN